MFAHLKLVEQRIREAQDKGQFENLEGAGKPLALKDMVHVPEDLRLAYKVLKNSGFLPPEIELRKQIRRAEELLEDMEDTEEKYRAMKRLNLLVLKLNTVRTGSAQFDVPEAYEHQLVERFGRNRS